MALDPLGCGKIINTTALFSGTFIIEPLVGRCEGKSYI